MSIFLSASSAHSQTMPRPQDVYLEPVQSPTSDGLTPSTSESDAVIHARTIAIQNAFNRYKARGITKIIIKPGVYVVDAPLEFPCSDYVMDTTTFGLHELGLEGVTFVASDEWTAPAGVFPAMLVTSGFQWLAENDPDAKWPSDSKFPVVKIHGGRFLGNGGINDNPWLWNISEADGGAVGSTTTTPYTRDAVAMWGPSSIENFFVLNMPGAAVRQIRGGASKSGVYQAQDREYCEIEHGYIRGALSGIVIMDYGSGGNADVMVRHVDSDLIRDVHYYNEAGYSQINEYHAGGALSSAAPAPFDFGDPLDQTMPAAYRGTGFVFENAVLAGRIYADNCREGIINNASPSEVKQAIVNMFNNDLGGGNTRNCERGIYAIQRITVDQAAVYVRPTGAVGIDSRATGSRYLNTDLYVGSGSNTKGIRILAASNEFTGRINTIPGGSAGFLGIDYGAIGFPPTGSQVNVTARDVVTAFKIGAAAVSADYSRVFVYPEANVSTVINLNSHTPASSSIFSDLSSFPYLRPADIGSSVQAYDLDLSDLADGSLTGTKVGFADTDNLWTATNIQSALEEMNDSINSGNPNGTGAKVHWSQLLGVPAGFADGSDDGGGGGSGTVNSVDLNDVLVHNAVVTLDFLGADFDATGTTEVDISIDSSIARDSEVNGYFADPSTNGSFSDSAWRSDLGLVIGTNVQAYDSDLTTWAGVTPGTGITTFLAIPSSDNFFSAITDESGSSGPAIRQTGATLVSPLIRIPISTGTFVVEESTGGTDRFIIDEVGARITSYFPMTITAGTATNPATPLAIAQTWNDAADTFRGLSVAITDTASAAASTPLYITGGASGTTVLAQVDKTGATTLGSSGIISGSTVLSLISAGGTTTLAIGSGGQVNFNSHIATLAGSYYAASNSAGYYLGTASDVGIKRFAASHLLIADSTTPQALSIANTHTSTTSGEWGRFAWETNVFRIGTVKGSGGGSARDFVLMTDNTDRLTINGTTGAISTTTPLTVYGDITSQGSLRLYDASIEVYGAITYDSNKYTFYDDSVVEADIQADDATFQSVSVTNPMADEDVPKEMTILVTPRGEASSTGTGKVIVPVPNSYNGRNLTAVVAYTATPGIGGTTVLDVYRVRGGSAADMLSTNPSIDAAEYSSNTGTIAIVNGSNDDVQTDDFIRVDITTVNSTTPAQDVSIVLKF